MVIEEIDKINETLIKRIEKLQKENKDKLDYEINKILEWKDALDYDSLLLMTSLLQVKNNASEAAVKDIETLKKRYPKLQLNLNGITRQVNAFSYYFRFKNLINSLLKEDYEEENKKKEIINYYLFDNSLKELVGYGPSYYYNFRAKKEKLTIYRISTDVEKDKKQFMNIKVKKDFQKPLDGEANYEQKLLMYRIMQYASNSRSRSKQLIAWATGQINGRKDALPSYSKSLGIDLFKYAHGASSLIIQKEANINCVEIEVHNERKIISFQELISRQDSVDLNNIVNFSFDFSEVRDDKLENLNKWLEKFLDNESVCTYANPIADRHVVSTFFGENNKVLSEELDETKIENRNVKVYRLTKAELLILMRAYKNTLVQYCENNIVKIEDIINSVLSDIDCLIKLLSNICEATSQIGMEQIIERLDGNISGAVRSMFQHISKHPDDLKKEVIGLNKELEEINDIRKIVFMKDILSCVDWKNEKKYFWDFFYDKNILEFFNGTESSDIMIIIKYVFFYFLEENRNEIKF